jgi:LmbE family N-acetylglucosaminyl deacetylase
VKCRGRLGLVITGLFMVGGSACTPAGTAHPLPAPSGGVLNIVAHQDDDLLFLSPHVLHAVQSGTRVRTVYVTAGDAGRAPVYWQQRELGVRAAYALMAGVEDVWHAADAGVGGHRIAIATLRAKPSVSLAFLRLPDGDVEGTGYAANQNQSLQKLWTGAITTIRAVDGSASYAKPELQNMLTALMSSFAADDINTLDFSRGYGQGDHSDHVTTAYLARAAQDQYASPHTFTGFVGYPINSRPDNLSPEDRLAKQAAFFAYAAYDSHVCASEVACAGRWGYPNWFRRQYQVAP